MADDGVNKPQDAQGESEEPEPYPKLAGEKRKPESNLRSSRARKGRSKWRDTIQNLQKPKTWSTSVALLIVVWVVGNIVQRGFETGFNWLDLLFEARFKSAEISVEYLKPAILEKDELDRYADTNGIQPFALNLDEDALLNYVVVPIKIRNSTRNPIDRVCLQLRLGNARLVDVQYVVRSPKAKYIAIQHSLPKLASSRSTNIAYFPWSFAENRGLDLDIYCSIAKDRGFGKVLSIERDGHVTPLAISPNKEIKWWYMKFIARNEAGESTITEALPLANPAFLDLSFENVTSVYSKHEPSDIVLGQDELSFSYGRTKVCFETGLDPYAEIDFYLLGKPLPGIDITPSVSLEGSPGVSFAILNSPLQFTTPDSTPLEEVKRELMPMLVRATQASNSIVIYWDAPIITNYSGVRIYRSAQRPLGAFNDLGDKIFDGYGSSKAIEFIHEAGPVPKETGVTEQTNLSTFLSRPPFEPKTNIVVIDSSLPAAPGNLRAWYYYSKKIDRMLHYVDKPPASNCVYTYTLYFMNDEGQSSYPVIVNAGLDKTAAGRNFRLLP